MSTHTSSDARDEKMEVLSEIGRQDLIDLFKDWQPKQAKNRTKGVPLDQKVSVSVTDQEKVLLEKELRSIQKNSGHISMSQLIRNKALASVDINQWKDIAQSALAELERINTEQEVIQERLRYLYQVLEEGDVDSDDDEDTIATEQEIGTLKDQLQQIVASGQKRTHRLSGRMSMPESETVKWRAQRLCISSSDYLRMMIFDLLPNSTGDAHMSFDSKRRFYISIVDVAFNGWGDPPTIYNCSQCENYMNEIRKMRDRIKQLESFL